MSHKKKDKEKRGEKGTLHTACPVCGAHITGKKKGDTGSGVEKETDFMPRPGGGSPFEAVIVCLSCGYGGYEEDFEREIKTAKKKEFVAWDPFRQLAIPDSMRMSLSDDQKYELAYLAGEFFESGHAALGKFMLHATWALKAAGGEGPDSRRMSRFRINAIEHYKKAAEDSSVQKHDRLTYNYLVAELSRREGLFAQAEDFFNRFFALSSSNKEWIHAALRLQELSREEDSSPRCFSEFQ